MIAISESAYSGYNNTQRYTRVCRGRSCKRRRQCDARSVQKDQSVTLCSRRIRRDCIPIPVTQPRRDARTYTPHSTVRRVERAETCGKHGAPVDTRRRGPREGRRRAACSRTPSLPEGRHPNCPCVQVSHPPFNEDMNATGRGETNGSKYATAHTSPTPVCFTRCWTTARIAAKTLAVGNRALELELAVALLSALVAIIFWRGWLQFCEPKALFNLHACIALSPVLWYCTVGPVRSFCCGQPGVTVSCARPDRTVLPSACGLASASTSTASLRDRSARRVYP